VSHVCFVFFVLQLERIDPRGQRADALALLGHGSGFDDRV